MLPLLKEAGMLLVELTIDLTEDLGSLIALHVFAALAHALQLPFELCLLVAAVFAQLHFLLVEACLFVDQSSDHHYLVLFDR